MKEKLKHETPGGAEVSDVNTEDETSLHVSMNSLLVTLTTTINRLLCNLVTAKIELTVVTLTPNGDQKRTSPGMPVK